MKSLLTRTWLALLGSLLSSSIFRSGTSFSTNAVSAYHLGVGIGDITGPVVETNMMGYADLSQTDTGLHMRQFSRAFIVASSATASAQDRILFINSDIAMGDSHIRRALLDRLASEYPDGRYTKDNVAFAATHSHAGVGGYLENLLPQITSLGYVKQTADAIVDGTITAIQKAEAGMTEGRLSVGSTTILGANINRSPTAYLANPASERARYEYDQDKEMTLLKFEDNSGTPMGFLNFFPVHGTSLFQNNTLVSTDNKGMAAYIYEAHMQPDLPPGRNTFVAGFVQSNVGDTSPNTEGAYCHDPGQPWHGEACEVEHSTCGGKVQPCHGRGPGWRISDFASNEIIGRKQFEGAQTIMNSNLASVTGSVRSVHVWMNMSFHSFPLANGTTVRTCPPALGYGFAGGTTDGPGTMDFIQGDNTTDPQNPFWEIVKGAVTPKPNAEQKACQEPKPILLNTGYADWPYEWSPSVVDVQMLRVGNFVMLVMPGEMTTMAGRRIREAIRNALISGGIVDSDAHVVIAGPANTYAHYITTREEYGVQRYEGASTIFGPYTLEAYIDKYSSLLPYLGDSIPVAPPQSDSAPSDQTGDAISLQTGVVFDAAPIGTRFGQVVDDVLDRPYSPGETVWANFVGANPRNNLRLEGTFLTVDALREGSWKVYRTDSHPETSYNWERTSTLFGTSTVNLTWTIGDDTPSGTYRFTYYGDHKPVIGRITAFTGYSGNFTVA